VTSALREGERETATACVTLKEKSFSICQLNRAGVAYTFAAERHRRGGGCNGGGTVLAGAVRVRAGQSPSKAEKVSTENDARGLCALRASNVSGSLDVKVQK